MKSKLTFLLIAGLQGLAHASTTDVAAYQTQQAAPLNTQAPFAQLVFGGFFTLYDFARPIVTASPPLTVAPQAVALQAEAIPALQSAPVEPAAAAAVAATVTTAMQQIAQLETEVPVAIAMPIAADPAPPVAADNTLFPISVSPVPTGGQLSDPTAPLPVAGPAVTEATQEVPEPSSFALALGALGLLGGSRMRRQGLRRFLSTRLQRTS